MDQSVMERSVSEVVDALPRPDPRLLDEARKAPADLATHEKFARALGVLQAIEQRPPAYRRQLGRTLGIASWNAERCKFPAPSANLLTASGADVLLLTELDVGMARSGNRHTIDELARLLGAGYVFGVEYVELGLGDDREKAWHAGTPNTVALHGNAILSRAPIRAPRIIRLDEAARWFSATSVERRIGSRMAIAGRIDTAGGEPLVAAVHLESSTDPEDRAREVAALLDGLESLAPGGPMVVGGDFNTAALPTAEAPDRDWFASPGRYEPLFAAFERAGFDWRLSNLPDGTERTRPDGTPVPPFRKIDWFFTRGVAPARPATLAAVDSNGIAISDHELLTVDVSLA
jgi:endonuclease/exonuclease/phosphatase family metal-dependent hydrolase